jgi:hypothetical protein
MVTDASIFTNIAVAQRYYIQIEFHQNLSNVQTAGINPFMPVSKVRLSFLRL